MTQWPVRARRERLCHCVIPAKRFTTAKLVKRGSSDFAFAAAFAFAVAVIPAKRFTTAKLVKLG
ncbi:MAG TPA: hypothetical protein VGQ93_12320 [Lysobacter sp.]|nr:hypothetical protein [Lysobacter sp.]